MIGPSIRRPVAVSMVYLAVALLGVAAWRNLPVELLPDTELPRLNVNAQWPGASPETTEALLTSPLEAEIQKVRGVERIESVSGEQNGAGTTEITVEFAEETDMDFARHELSERLSAIEDELPPGVSGPFVQPYVPEEFEEQQQPFLSYSITGPYTLEALRAHLDERVVPAVREVRGVARVEVYGGRERVLEIELDEDRILALGLTPLEVRDRIASLEYVQEAGAVFDAAGERRTLAIRLRAESIADVLRLPVLMDGGRVVRVSDVATIHDTFEDATSHYRINGNPAVAFVVVREYGGNEIDIADRVKTAVDSLAGAHPPGVRLILDQDRSEQIRAQLHDLRYRATISAIVIFAVLLLFLRSLRSTAIVFATIAFSILITLNLLYFAGFTLNVLTLMGLAMGFGLIVDNAIVVLENVYRRRRLGEPADVAAGRGAREVVLPVLAATATTLVVLVPFVYLQGELRAYYVPLALAVGFALLASMFVAFSFIPGLAAVALRRRPVGGGEGGGGGGGTAGARAGAGAGRPGYIRFYAALVGFTVRHPWVTIVLTLACLGGSYHLFDRYVTRGVVWGRWGSGQDTYISITFEQPRGEELERTDELVRYFEAKLAELPEVERFVTRVYPRNAFIRVTFPDSLELTAVPVAIKERMYAYSHLFGGAEVRVYGYGPSFYGGGGSPPNYAIRILGYNYETVREIAEGLGRRLQRFSRIRDVDTNSSGGWFNRDRATELVLALDRSRLALHGLTARGVTAFIGASLRGRTTSDRLRIGGEEVALAVKLEGHRDLDLQQLDELLVPASSGGAVRLGDVSSVEERGVMSRIRRSDQQYERIVAYEFRGPSKLGDIVRDAVVAATALPPGYTIEEDQRWEWSAEEREQIYGVLAVALVLVFMVTAALFESIRQPFCVLLTVPMALIGVFLVFFYTGAAFTREAYIGVIMMGGIVVNNAILLVDHVNRLRRVDGIALEAAAVRGTLERVRPILMTSATTIFGLLPLVLFSEYANENIWNALGYALVGGLASSTLLVLTVTPALYVLFERRAERRQVALAGLGLGLGLGLAGCGDARSADTPRAERTDSAGVEIVVTPGADRALEWTFTPTLQLGGEAEGPASFYRLWESGAGVDSAGRIYVLDPGAYRVVVFDSTGRHLRSVGTEGGGPGELQSPVGIVVRPNGAFGVYDYAHMGFVRFDQEGVLVPDILRPEVPFFGGNVARTSAGPVFATRLGAEQPDVSVERLLRVGPTGDTTGIAAVETRLGQGYVQFPDCGIGLRIPATFSPGVVFDARDDRVYVSDSVDYAIDVYEGDTLVASYRRPVATLVDGPERAVIELAAERGESFRISAGPQECDVPWEAYVEAVGVRDVVPLIEALAVAPDGTLWVRRRGEDPNRALFEIDIFASDGAYLGTLPADAPWPIAFMPDGDPVGIQADALDIERLVVYDMTYAADAS